MGADDQFREVFKRFMDHRLGCLETWHDVTKADSIISQYFLVVEPYNQQ